MESARSGVDPLHVEDDTWIKEGMLRFVWAWAFILCDNRQLVDEMLQLEQAGQRARRYAF